MQDLAELTKLCTTLLEIRDTLEKLLGNNYAEATKIPKMLIIAVCERTKVDTLQAATDLVVKTLEDGKPNVAFLILAAATDLLMEAGKKGECHGA